MPLWGKRKTIAARESGGENLEFWPTPIPAPRVPAGEQELVFASEHERDRQQQACSDKVLDGCTQGLRASCSLQAARQCSGPPAFLRLLGLAAPARSWQEREACQESCMAACLQQGQPACQKHAQQFCGEAFAGPVAGQQQQQQQ